MSKLTAAIIQVGRLTRALVRAERENGLNNEEIAEKHKLPLETVGRI